MGSRGLKNSQMSLNKYRPDHRGTDCLNRFLFADFFKGTFPREMFVKIGGYLGPKIKRALTVKLLNFHFKVHFTVFICMPSTV
jgi:hypothetical protein